MKKLFLLAIALVTVFFTANAQNPTIIGSATQCVSAPYTYSVVGG
jgi:hypothetical protein